MNYWEDLSARGWGKNVGQESRKTWQNKIDTHFFRKYMSGSGYLKDVKPILPTAIIVGLDYPNYDGKTLPFNNNSQDFCYSSHCLEHITDYITAIQEQFRVCKPGGHIIITVPHRDLYEKSEFLPSRWNADHRRFYLPSNLLKEIEESLVTNSYRIRYLQDNDVGHDYEQPANEHSKGQYEITVVIEKLLTHSK